MQASSAGEHEPQRDEGQVGDREVDLAADVGRGQRADVGAVVDLDPVVGAQRPGELPVPDVDGDDLPGAGAEQDVGEAAGRRAGVEAAAAGHGEVGERRQRAGELEPTARGVVRVGLVGETRTGVSAVDPGGGFVRDHAAYLDPSRR